MPAFHVNSAGHAIRAGRLEVGIDHRRQRWELEGNPEVGTERSRSWKLVEGPWLSRLRLVLPGRPTSGGPASLRVWKWLLILAPSPAALLPCAVYHWGKSLTTMEVACLDCRGQK